MEAILFLLLVLVAGSVVTVPLRRREHATPLDARTAALEAARDAKLREIRDAELDHRTGKLSDDDYAALDGTLRSEAADLLRELEEARA
jgi:hypothetical protein